MEMVAICPNCHVSNPPTNTACEVCKVALGANLADPSGKRSTSLVIALVVTLLIGLPIVGFKAHVAGALVALFYGPFLTSYFARGNVVSVAALGGVVATVLLFLLACAIHWTDIKGMLAALTGTSLEDDAIGEATTAAVLLGAPLVALIAGAACMAGASAGEHLSVVRRKRTA